MSQTIQRRFAIKRRKLCDRLGMSYATLLRWQRRSENGRPLLARPGPKKLGSLPFEELRRDVEALRHCCKRTAGTGDLHQRYRESISRRDLGALVSAERQRLIAGRNRHLIRVHWNHPNLAWAIDATEYGCDRAGRKLVLVPALDLASRFGFEPLAILDPSGEQIAAYLQSLFRRHGAPLFLKRDNGSIFNNHAVDDVLAAHGVIPLNSPAAYPRYNGAIEKAIRELKETMHACLPGAPPAWDPQGIAPYTSAATHLRNCATRRVLGRRTAAETYHLQKRCRFGKRERHATFEWIRRRSNATIREMGKTDRRSLNAAWRHAAESWLRCQGLITVSQNGEVLPHLSPKSAS
jgi:hypothetical protein